MIYCNEFDAKAAHWLECLPMPKMKVDSRSIKDVKPEEVESYTQCHFFAGIGGWPLALQIAGWPIDAPVWTGSCPCQPFSNAGKRTGTNDDRHLWPEFRRLIDQCRPSTIFGEQVASKLGRNWLAVVRSDLEAMGYAVGAADLCAASCGAPHIRQRLFWVAHSNSRRLEMFKKSNGKQDGQEFKASPRSNTDGCRNNVGVAHSISERRDQGRNSDGQHDWDQSASGCKRSVVGNPSGAGSQKRIGKRTMDRKQGYGDERKTVEFSGYTSGMANPGHEHSRWGSMPTETEARRTHGKSSRFCDWSDVEFIPCRDGKARPVVADLRSLVDGLSMLLARCDDELFSSSEKEVRVYAKTEKCRPIKALLEVWDFASAQKIWKEPRGFFGIQEAEILLPYLLELKRRYFDIRSQVESDQASQEDLRSVWLSRETTRPSQKRRLHRQSAREYSNTLCLLSQLLACNARQAFETLRSNASPIPLLQRGFPNRVAALRGLGNAIVPQLAAEFIKAFMEVIDFNV